MMDDGAGSIGMPGDTGAEGPTEMRTVTSNITVGALAAIAEDQFQNLVKAVVDVARGVMVVGGEMHADEEAVLLAEGSSQSDLWGINLHPEHFGTPAFIEYDSVINIRPRQGNRSRSVEDTATQGAIVALVERLVTA